ncbi:hypothetical protein [Marinicella rhabdoformis]|uniref:hypothetical protein n=1 Tax=Marinicella rhabdoformis TaxID=2580566 RepID=UPI0012AEB620|nr:hypothetical protein [Marinicella rhabdoformis]
MKGQLNGCPFFEDDLILLICTQLSDFNNIIPNGICNGAVLLGTPRIHQNATGMFVKGKII